MVEQVIETLKKNQLSITDSRKTILQLFMQSDGALAHMDIENNTGEEFDRVTIYRTLQTFVDKGIIHTIPSSDNAIRYALCKDACGEGHHHDNQIHFMCDCCGTTYCLDHVQVPTFQLPGGFLAARTDMVVSGSCNRCNQ
jgi:Fur family ferric uptake transcriptional regulator